MTVRWRILAVVTAVAAFVAPAGIGQADPLVPGQLPSSSALVAAGFQRDTDASTEIDTGRVMYPSACAPATVDAQYSDPAGHRGREYAVTGFDAMGVTGPAGTVGVDAYAYDTADRSASAFDHLRSLFDRPCPLDHDSIAWEFVRESPITGTESPDKPAQAFTVTAGNEILGSRITVTFSLHDTHIVAAGYGVDQGGAAPDPDNSAHIADRAAGAALEALVG